MKRILAIDGGGIRGIIPAIVLGALEERTGRPTADLFDLIAGTSTGGILACSLTVPGDLGRPRFPASELVGLYETEGPAIVERSLGKRITSLEGLIDERYDAKPLREALGRYLGHARLQEAVTPILVPAYELEGRAPFFFRSERAVIDPDDYDFAMVDVAHATSAAPTYWEPLRIGPYSLVDGGVYAANPAMCAWAEAKAQDPDLDAVMVSLGTGVLTRPIHHDDAAGWGLLEWARPIIDVVFDGASDTVDYQLRQVIGEDRHFRFQTELELASDDLDDASEANLKYLRSEAEQILRDQAADLERLLPLLAP
jgi:uncharacterized protein